MINTQVNALTENTKWVTYTIGGNDAGFKETLEACSWPGGVSCSVLLQNAKNIIEGTLPTQFDKINHLIKLKAKWAKVIVLDYPRIFKVQPEDCNLLTFFLEADMIEMNKLAELMGKKLKEAASRAGPDFRFVDVMPAFEPHALCSAEPWLTNYTKTPDEAESFHPNILGHAFGYFPAVLGVTG